jgi:pimeloyl-ACP methyl ester carboxylesterase
MASREVEYSGSSFNISYEILNPSSKRVALFLHGWGSSKEVMKSAFGNGFKDFKHIYLDMPGFGASNSEVVLTTKDYSKIVDLFLQSLDVEAEMVFGHSFGGKVATLLNPKNLILLSSSGILVPKPLSVRAKIALFKALKPLGVSKIREMFISSDAKGMNEAMYETFKRVVDEDFRDNFKNCTSNTLLFWGRDDSATPLWTAKEIATLIKKSKLYELEGDHYFFLDKGELIEREVLKEFRFD